MLIIFQFNSFAVKIRLKKVFLTNFQLPFLSGNNEKKGCQSKNAKLFVIIGRDVNILIKFDFLLMQDDIDMEPLHKLFIYRKKLVKRT